MLITSKKTYKKAQIFFLLFDLVGRHTDEKLPTGGKADLCISFNPEQWVLGGKHVKKVEVEAEIESIRQYVGVPYVMTYGAPDIVPEDREVVIEKMDLGDFEVVQRSNEVSMLIDLSGIVAPNNSQFRNVLVDMGRIVSGKISVVGVPELKIPIERTKIRIGFA
jgi:hypothetical protein